MGNISSSSYSATLPCPFAS